MQVIKKLLKEFKSEPTGNEFLDKRWHEPHNQRDYYRFFFQLCKKLKPEVVVELGTCSGSSAANFAAHSGLVIGVDHLTDPGDEYNEVKVAEVSREFSNFVFCKGWTCDAIYEEEKDKHSKPGENAYPKVLKALDGRKIDVLFIDSWHHDYQAWRDWEAYKPLLKDGALVICDDIHQGSPGGGIFNMKAGFWDKLEYEKHLDETLMYYPIGFFTYELAKN